MSDTPASRPPEVRGKAHSLEPEAYEALTLEDAADAATAQEDARPASAPIRRGRPARRPPPATLRRLQRALEANLAEGIPARGLPAQEIAARAALSRTTLHLLQRGELDAQLSTVCAVADALGVSPALLLLDQDDWRAILWSVIELLPELFGARPDTPSELPTAPDEVLARMKGRAGRKATAGTLPALVAERLLGGTGRLATPAAWTALLGLGGAGAPPEREALEGAVQVGLALGRRRLDGLGLLLGGNLSVGMAGALPTETSLTVLADWIRQAEGRVVLLTGAGLAAEAKLPTYRGEGGLLTDPRAELLTSLAGLEAEPAAFVAHYRARGAAARRLAEQAPLPPAFGAIARLQRAGLVPTVLTATPDGVLTQAGVAAHEIFGSYARIRCHICQAPASWEAFADERVTEPRCGCGGLLRPDLVLRNEPAGEAALQAWQALDATMAGSHLVLVAGTSLRDRRVARFAMVARTHGARLAIIEPGPTHLFDALAHWRAQATAGTALTALCDALGAP